MTGQRILVVDDEPTVRQTFELVLEDAGYEVEGVGTGEEGVEKVQREPWDLVFCDLRLPGIDGLETFKRIKAIRPLLPVVIITAYFEELERRLQEAWLSGMQDVFLRKPLGNEEIVQAARTFLSQTGSPRG